MKTREERRLRRRIILYTALSWLFMLAAAALWCMSYCGAACTLEGVSDGEAVTGAFVWAGLFVQLVVKLDRARGRTKK